MTICDITQFYSPVGGGVRRYLSEKAKHLALHGHRHVLIIPGEKTGCQQEGPHRIYTIASPLISRKARYRALIHLGLIEEILEREKPDLIESGDPYQISWKVLASGQGLHIPVVGFYHSHFPEATVAAVAQYFGDLSVLIAQEVAKRYVVALYNRFARTLIPTPGLTSLLQGWGVENTATLGLGIDTNFFYPDQERGDAWRELLSLPQRATKGRTLLLYVGRLSPEKNTRILFESFAHLHQLDPHGYHFIVIGDGTLRPLLERLQTSTGQVTWRSYCNDPVELADFYRAADVFVHPGIHETFGLVTLESQACGTPVVGIVGSPMDHIVFSDQKDWARENTPKALTKALLLMTQKQRDPQQRPLALDIATMVAKRYDWKHIFNRLFSIYEEVIAEYK